MFRFSASGLVPDEGFEAWREIMARMFHIDRCRAVVWMDNIPSRAHSCRLK